MKNQYQNGRTTGNKMAAVNSNCRHEISYQRFLNTSPGSYLESYKTIVRIFQIVPQAYVQKTQLLLLHQTRDTTAKFKMAATKSKWLPWHTLWVQCVSPRPMMMILGWCIYSKRTFFIIICIKLPTTSTSTSAGSWFRRPVLCPFLLPAED